MGHMALTKSRSVLWFILLFIALSFAPSTQQTLKEALEQLSNQVVMPLLGMFLLVLVIGAAIIYAMGQLMGSETRAKATHWATSMANAALISGILYLLLTWLTSSTALASALGSVFPCAATEYMIPHLVPSLLFAIASVIFFYVIAAVFQHPPLDAIKHEELAALLVTILLIIGWRFFCISMTNVTRALMCTAEPGLCAPVASFVGPPAFDTVETCLPSSAFGTQANLAYYALEILFTKLKDIYTNLYLFEIFIGFLSTVSFPVGALLPGLSIISITFNPFDGLVLLSEAHTVIVEAIGYTMMVILAKQNLMLFVRDAVPTILLPIGIMMRAFPWFRTTGSSIIAICIVAYFIYPLAILLSNYLIFDVYKAANFGFNLDIAAWSSSSLTPEEVQERLAHSNEEARKLHEIFQNGETLRGSVEDTCGSGVLGVWCSVKNFVTGALEIASGAISQLWAITKVMFTFGGDMLSMLWSGLTPTGVVGGMYNYLIIELQGISEFLVLVMFTSVLEIIITITMYRNIALLIGGEVEIAGLAKLV